MKLRKSIDALEARLLLIVLFGEPGSWKSSTSFTMPKPVLHFDFDNGFHRTLPDIRPDSFEMSSWSAFYKYVMSRDFEILVKENGYKSVALDTIGTLIEDLIIPHLIQEPGNSTRSGGLRLDRWTIVSEQFNVLKKRLQSLGLHICAVCHGKEVGENEKKWGLDVKGNTRNIIYRSADMIGFTFPQGDHIYLDFNPTSLHAGKNMAALPVMRIPNPDSALYEDFLATTVIDACNKKITTQSKQAVDANNEYKEWVTEIDAASEEELAEKVPLILEIKKSLVRVKVGTYFKQKLKSINRKYDKVTKSLVVASEKMEGEKEVVEIKEISQKEKHEQYEEKKKESILAIVEKHQSSLNSCKEITDFERSYRRIKLIGVPEAKNKVMLLFLTALGKAGLSFNKDTQTITHSETPING